MLYASAHMTKLAHSNIMPVIIPINHPKDPNKVNPINPQITTPINASKLCIKISYQELVALVAS